MTRISKKSKPLIGAIIITAAILAGHGVVLSAVGYLDVAFSFKTRFVPSVDLPEFPEGISFNKAESHLLKFNKAKHIWHVDITPEKDYVHLILYAGRYSLYNPLVIEFDDYVYYSANKEVVDSWIHDMATFSGTKGKGKRSEGIEIPIPIGPLPKPVKSIIGEGGPRITVTGYRRISFSGRSEWQDDLTNTGTFKQSKFPSLHMEQTSRFKIRGDIGSKVHIEVDQDSNRDTELANTLKLRYKGEEDEIIQAIEAGNTNLSLPNSQFIGYSENVQGLFGIKATAKIGNIELTMITSQEKGSSEKSTFQAGAQDSANRIFDYDYLHNVYFWLAKAYEDYDPALDSLMQVVLYKRGSDLDKDIEGIACVDPHWGLEPEQTGRQDTLYYITYIDSARGEYYDGPLKRIPETEYDVIRSGWFVILNLTQRLQDSDILAAYIEYAHKDSINDPDYEVYKEGNLTYVDTTASPPDTMVILKLIKTSEPSDTALATWDLEWRNVYNLNSRNLNPVGFDLQIYKGHGDLTTDTLDQDGVCYITLLDLDKYNNSNPSDTSSDCLFDFNNYNLDVARGHLIFPYRQPFAHPNLESKNTAIYNHYYKHPDVVQGKQYYIYVKTSQRGNTFRLGRTNIIDNSEVVRMGDGRVLQRGVDYTIDYQLGMITFLSEEVLDPSSNITVDFEYAPFFQPEKKSLYGVSARYAINENSWISLAGMYRKETTREYRPRVGREPRRAMIWDSNFLFCFEPSFLTEAVDVLPLVETDSPSMIKISGEVAQSFPNPNLRKDAYIDDFEGTRQYSDLLTRRGIWTIASPPDGTAGNSVRGGLIWYNPYYPYTITQIWPEKEEAIREQDNKTDVLILEYYPLEDTNYVEDPTESWAGIIRPMFAGSSDQSRTKFIEIWYYFGQEGSGNGLTLHIDVGRISEDVDDDGEWDTEDFNHNGVFEQDEDVGLDGMTDEEERRYFDTDDPDPSGDNWAYSQSEPNNYTHINGTEGNRNDPDRLNRFDTEDINNSGYLDNIDSYFRYTVNLENQECVVETTTTGWKLLRIPFQDTSVFITPAIQPDDFSQIKFVRLWLDNAPQPCTLKFASIQLVGNKWQTMPITYPDSNTTVITGFEVTVKNTHENIDYNPPPGVSGEIIRETGMREKEQSLVLYYENLLPGQIVATYWYLYQLEDYTLYNKMKMYVHGDSSAESGNLIFFFRAGQDTSNNFYEYRTKLEKGWSEQNYVEIDFAKMTALKSYLHANHPDDYTTADTVAGHYRVKGNPSLSKVQWFVMGLENDSLADNPDTLSGAVWCDELRVTDVRRKSDFAGRVSANIRLADLVDITANYSRIGADYFRLSAKKPEGSLSTRKSLTTNLKLHKFFPPLWGLSFPVTLSWQTSLQLPRLKPGSDIILPSEMRMRERTESKTWSIMTSEQFNRNTKNWLWNLTLNRIRTRLSYSKKYNISPAVPTSNSTNYGIFGAYDLTPRIKPFFKPFSWTKFILFPSGIHEAKMYFLPSSLLFDATINGRETFSINQRGIKTSSYVRDLTMKQAFKMDLFSTLKTNFSATTNRDIKDPSTLYFSLDPRKIKLGRERTYSQNFSISFSPKFSRQLMPRFQFNSTYSDNSDLVRNPDSTRSTQMRGTLRSDVTIDLVQILGISKTKFGKRPMGRQGMPGTPPEKQEQKDEKENEEKGEEDEEEIGEGEEFGEEGGGIPNPLIVFKGVLNVFRSVKPVKVSFSNDKSIGRSGLYERPSWIYTLGFTDKTHVRRKESVGLGTRDQSTFTKDYSFNSGLALIRNLDINSSYKYRQSITRSTNDPMKSRSVEFPRLDVNFSGVENLPFIRSFSRTASIQTNYTRKVDVSSNAATRELHDRNTMQSFSPFLGLNLSFKNGIRATLRYDYSKRKIESLRQQGDNKRISYDQDNTFRWSLSYSLTAPRGLNIPLIGKVKFDSQLTMSLDFNKSFKKSWYFQSGNKTVDRNSVETGVEPRLSYRFSAKITGGLQARWFDSNDKIQQRKRHVRELGIWTELRF